MQKLIFWKYMILVCLTMLLGTSMVYTYQGNVLASFVAIATFLAESYFYKKYYEEL